MATPAHSNSPPRLSIIVATWQAEATLQKCLTSIIEQSFSDWELLIADGASSDLTVSIIRQHESHIAWWHSEPDQGIYDAWNKALAHARGEYVCFIGADDVWSDKDSLTRMFTAIGEQNYDLVTSRGLFHDSQTEKSLQIGAAWDYRRIGRRMIVCHPGLFHRRTLFDDYGFFDSTFKITGDLDFLLRLPENIRTLHVDAINVVVEAAGVSRRNVLKRLREQRMALTRCERHGPVRAYIAWLDKLWRLPIAQLFNIPH